MAAIVSLGVGLYEDIAVPEYDTMGNRIPGVKWVEGVAIIVAVLLVVLVGSVNDFQKERQFRKLNAKKEDSVVKVNFHKISRSLALNSSHMYKKFIFLQISILSLRLPFNHPEKKNPRFLPLFLFYALLQFLFSLIVRYLFFLYFFASLHPCLIGDT